MRKPLVLLVILFFLWMNPIHVLAGNLNENEEALIGMARGTFEMDGITYVVSESYINDAIGYFMQDNVDVSASDKQEIVQAVNSSIARGVEEGYLIPLETSGEDNQVDEKAPVSSGAITDLIEDAIEQADERENAMTAIESKEPVVAVDPSQGVVRVTLEDQTDILTVNTVIKNTGFHLYRTVVMSIALSSIVIGCIIVAVKFRLFAPYEE